MATPSVSVYVNKVDLNGETVLDLTADTVTPEALDAGVTAHNAAGVPITGTRVASVTYYKGTDEPAADLGNNGDVYFQNVEGLI